jgi:hypothetical protein
MFLSREFSETPACSQKDVFAHPSKSIRIPPSICLLDMGSLPSTTVSLPGFMVSAYPSWDPLPSSFLHGLFLVRFTYEHGHKKNLSIRGLLLGDR